MKKALCIIGLAGSLMLAMSAQAFAVHGERVATVEDYPAHSQVLSDSLAASPVCEATRLCTAIAASAGTCDVLFTFSSKSAHLSASGLASQEVTPPLLARITAPIA